MHKRKSLATQCSIEMARSAHVPLKNLTQEKNPYTLFPCSVGGAVQAGTDRSAHVPLKSLTQEKIPYTLFPCSVGLCRPGQLAR